MSLVASSGHYACVVTTDDEHGQLSVIDIADPSTPRPVGIYAPSVGRRLMAVATSGDYGLRVIDVSNPTAPREVARSRATWAHKVAMYANWALVLEGYRGLETFELIESPAFTKVLCRATPCSFHGTTLPRA